MSSFLWRIVGIALVSIMLVSLAGCLTSGDSSTSVTVSPTEVSEETSGVPPTEEEVPRILVEDVKTKLDADEEIVIVDTRSVREYEVSHIEGAVSMPLLEIDDRYEELPKDKEIVLYCT